MVAKNERKNTTICLHPFYFSDNPLKRCFSPLILAIVNKTLGLTILILQERKLTIFTHFLDSDCFIIVLHLRWFSMWIPVRAGVNVKNVRKLAHIFGSGFLGVEPFFGSLFFIFELKALKYHN